MLQVAFGWLLAQEPVTAVIAGATTPEQIRANAEAGYRMDAHRGGPGRDRHDLSGPA